MPNIVAAVIVSTQAEEKCHYLEWIERVEKVILVDVELRMTRITPQSQQTSTLFLG